MRSHGNRNRNRNRNRNGRLKSLPLLQTILPILIMISLGLGSEANQTNQTNQTNQADGERQGQSGAFIRRWLALGPLIEGETAPKAIEIDYLLLATGTPEWQFATLEGTPKAGDRVMLTLLKLREYSTQEQIWKVLKLPENGDVEAMFVEEGEVVDFAVAYLITLVESEEAAKRELLIGSDDSVKVWLNGKVIHTAAVEGALTPDRDRVAVELKKGMNCLMLKVTNLTGPWQLTVRFDDESGLQFFDTPERQLLSLGRKPPRLSSLQLELEIPASEIGTGTGTEGIWKTYRYVDGLADNWVNAIIQDKEGIIWVGAEGGLSRFDGVNWQTYTQKDGLVDNRVNVVMEDRKGAIWVGTEGGVSRFDEKRKQWKTFTQKDGLVNNDVHTIMEDKEGRFWFGTEGRGVSKFDEKRKHWQTFTQKDGLANNYVNAIMQDKEGVIWFGTGGGVSRFDGKNWKTYTQKDGLAYDGVHTIIQDKDGMIWVGTNSGVSLFDGKKWISLGTTHGLVDNRVHVIIQDQEGSMWFGTWTGVSRFDGKSKKWKTFTQREGLAANNVHAIMQDKEGAIWFGTWYNGISRFESQGWKTYTQTDGLTSNGVGAIMQDKEGAIWFGTSGGVSRLDGKNWKTYTPKNGLAGNYVYEIIQDKEGAIWFGTNSGVSRFDGKSWETYIDVEGIAYKQIRAIIQDKEGTIWIGTDDSGVSRFDGKRWKTYTKKDGFDTTQPKGLSSDSVYDIMQDKEGAIWFGTLGGGVSRFNGKSQSWKTYTIKDGLVSRYVRVIMQDKGGAIWFGSRDGVSKFDGKSNSWQTFTQKDGLINNSVFAIIQDRDGIIWIGTENGGFSRFDGRCFQTINSKDGLVNDFVTCFYPDQSGQIWIGTEGGIVQFTPNKISPPVYVSQILADEKTYPRPGESLSLPAGVKRLAISYHAISFKTLPGRMQYFYQLVGKDSDSEWQGPTNRETMEYFDLEPGSYTFKVQAVDRDLNYSQIVSLQLILPPLWYQLAWVRGFLAGGGLAFFCAFGFVSWRLSAHRIATRKLEQQLRQQEARERLALQQSEHRFRTIANTAVDGIISTNSKGEIIFFNQGAVKQFGYGQDEVIGKSIQILIPERYQSSEAEASEAEKWLGFLATGEAKVLRKTVELKGLRKDGREFPIEVSFTTWNAGNDLYFTSIVRDITERKQAEEAFAHQAQLQILRYQLNPHFLFNALNTIRALISENPNGAEMVVSEFSEYLRYSLLNKNWFDVSLQDEIEAIRNFLAIEKIRFEDQLDISLEVEPAAEKYRVPGFFMQPLVENAIKYGMQTSPMPLQIRIAAYVRESLLHIEVSNTGSWEKPEKPSASASESQAQSNASESPPRPTQTRTGIGIQNVKERLTHMFPNRHQFEILERDGWVRVVIKIGDH